MGKSSLLRLRSWKNPEIGGFFPCLEGISQTLMSAACCLYFVQTEMALLN